MSTDPLSGSATLASAIRVPALPRTVSRAAAAVLPALAVAAERTGVDFNALYNTARLESGFNPSAKAKTSSATGLFQFIDSTWLQMLRRHGPAHGISGLPAAQALALRKDPGVSSLMAAEHMADNAQALEAGIGRPASQTDLYLAHFLGLGGAMRFLRGMATAPGSAGATIFPAAARANRAIFYAGGVPRSLEQIHQLLAGKMAGTSAMAPAARQASSGAGSVAGQALAAAPPAAVAESPKRPANDADGAPALQPAQVARFAYLILAELGG